MKRPPGLWVLLSAGVLWLSMQDVYGIRATALVFGKTTTTTTTTTTTEEPASLEEEGNTTELSADANSTKPTLTGNPQIDYVWDPNLPKELNGYNLSDYPFYERVPKDIDFKCDGLHDGFYASVKHKCQVYHHCLYGTRYDFLCANYTAFDQKTFICHFASEVDCANSKKFWHRNDALYKAATTTTIKPIIYTPAPHGAPLTVVSPKLMSPPIIAIPSGPAGPRRSIGLQRRPYRRRRPQFYYEDDYYDDYYDNRPRHNRGRKRPRPRPRPLYEDDYEEYDDDIYERNGGGGRRPYNRRPSSRRRNKDKELDYDDEDSLEDEDYRLSNKRRIKDRKKGPDIDDDEYLDDRKNSRRRPHGNVDSSDKKSRRPVYHHCLFGTRYDFLCANYTAFDQTLFNCNFVSNVDCENSKKFWSRNDELYKTKSTTTQAPVVYNFYTPPPSVYERTPSSSYQSATGYLPQQPQQVPQPQPQILQPLPIEPKRRPRPSARRRPQYDYYDEDDYDERPVMRRKRPRRPVYYDDYDDYEDERFDRRGASRRRRPMRRPMRRDKDRRRDYYYEDDEYEDDLILEKKTKNNRRKMKDDYDEEEEDKSRTHSRTEKPNRRGSKRPVDEVKEDYEDTVDHRKKNSNKGRGTTQAETKNNPRLGVRRPLSEEHEEDLQQADGIKSFERSRKSNRESTYAKPSTENRPIIKPVSGTIYDRPRVAPRINLPVPKNVASKFSYKPLGMQTSTISKEDIDVESSQIETKINKEGFTDAPLNVNKRTKVDSTQREMFRTIRKRPVKETTDDTKFISSTEIELTSNAPAPAEKPHVVRKYKRPFLPSRGGNPYSGRSLEPVGEKSIDKESIDFPEDDVNQENSRPESGDIQSGKSKSVSKNTDKEPTRIVVPIRARHTTTESKNPMEPLQPDVDILNENYDVTLNEALSPVLPNLPVRSLPSGFSNTDDYIYNEKFQKTPKYYDQVGASRTYYS